MFSNYTQKQHEGEEFPACGTSSSKTGAVLVDYLKYIHLKDKHRNGDREGIETSFIWWCGFCQKMWQKQQ